MNYAMVLNQFGLLSSLLAAIMLIMAGAFVALGPIADEHPDANAILALCFAGAITLAFGGASWWTTRRGSQFLGRKEALLLVAVSWLGGAAVSGLPYWFWARLAHGAGTSHPFVDYASCYFEAMSGLTTTGATVLSDIESVPHSLLLWRSLTHWLGGLGIIVLFVAVLPGLGVGGKRLFQIESPGPAPEGLQPQVRETARRLWYIYMGLTLLEIAALWTLTPMTVYESVCHTFATLATGGFSTRGASIGAYYDTPAVDWIVIVFMVLAGMNFGLFYQLLRGNWRRLLEDVELRVYLAIMLAGVLLVTLIVATDDAPPVLTTGEPLAAGAGEAFRQSTFTTVSIQTTTGFCTSDFNRWPFLAKAILITLMFIGGCSGSTAGGVKVIRAWIAFKVLRAEIEHVFRPHVIRPLKVGRTTVHPELRLGAVVYLVSVGLIFALGSVSLMLCEQLFSETACDYTSASTACVATMFNVGPGFSRVGAIENYGWFSSASKWIMSLLMALGRLELFAIFVLCSPKFWRRE
ncbi:MAG: TrkH family potassium uptake protein [Planctomycetota bacterium]|nr:MAG: TrkH family potassium uptake protein [Planctomycetota bacterium]